MANNGYIYGDHDFLKWWKDHYGADYDGTSGITRTDSMSDEDVAIGSTLLNNYKASQKAENTFNENEANIDQKYDKLIDTTKGIYDNSTSLLLKNYEQGKQSLATRRDQSLQGQSVILDKALKYLPMQMKRQGLGGLGVSETASLTAYNNYAQNIGRIEGEFNDSMNELDANYSDKKLQYDTQLSGDLAKYEVARGDEHAANKGAFDSATSGVGKDAYGNSSVGSVYDKYGQIDKDAKDEEFGRWSALINNSSATDLTGLLAELGITVKDFNAHIDSLNLSADQKKALKGQAAQKVKANSQAATDKAAADTKETQTNNFNTAWRFISQTSSKSLKELTAYINGLALKEDDKDSLLALATDVVAINTNADEKERAAATERVQASNYDMAFNSMVGSSATSVDDLKAFYADWDLTAVQRASLDQYAQNIVDANTNADEAATERVQASNYTMAYNTINGSPSTSVEELMATYADWDLTTEQRGSLDQLAKDVVAINTNADEAATERVQASNYSMACDIIRTSSATSVEELQAKYQDFNLTDEQRNTLNALAENAVAAYTATTTEDKQIKNYNFLEEFIKNSIATDEAALLAELDLDNVELTDSDRENLKKLAKQQVANNKQAASDKAEAKATEERESTFSSWQTIIQYSSATTLDELMADLGIETSEKAPDFETHVNSSDFTDAQKDLLLKIANLVTSENLKRANENAETDAESDRQYAEDLAMSFLEYYLAEGDYEGGLAHLETNKDKISTSVYDQYYDYFTQKLGIDPDDEDDMLDITDPNYNQQGGEYDKLTQEEKDERIVKGLDNIASGGRDYKITSDALGVDSYYLKNPEFNDILASEGIDLSDTNLNAKQPKNGMVVKFRGDKDGYIPSGFYGQMKSYEAGEYYLSGHNKSNYSTYTRYNYIAVYYNGNWYLAEDQGATKGTEGSGAVTGSLAGLNAAVGGTGPSSQAVEKGGHSVAVGMTSQDPLYNYM